MHDRSPWPRRLIMPLAILAVAAGLAWWSARVDARQHVEVHAFVAAICDDVREGRDPSARLGETDPLVADLLVRRLQEVLDPATKLMIEVTAGDTSYAGVAAGSATHTAILTEDATAVMGLRVVHLGSDARIAIIGFWLP